jgi:LDH2 family malate/lactate/ureidoglycolate dehydrogenase
VYLQGFTSKIQENAAKYSESEVTAMQSRADVATYTILAEMNHFQEHRVIDFKEYMENYLKGQIAFYQQVSSEFKIIERHCF